MGATPIVVERVQRWIDAVARRGVGIATEDLQELFSADMVAQWPNLDAADGFRQATASSRFAVYEIEAIDAIDEHHAVVRLRGADVALWCHITVEPEHPHRIASVRDTLEDGVSLSAINVGISRELHRRWSTRRVFDDWLAQELGGGFVTSAVERALAGPATSRPVMPLARFRLAEERLDEAIAGGCDQYLVLGAGLDSWAYRNADLAAARGVTVFEVDTATTQRFKRSRLSAAGIAEPGHVVYVPVDFETDTLAACLAGAGFDANKASVVAWLGVIYYLTQTAIDETLSYIGTFAPGSELILDYFRPPETWDLGMRNGALLAATNDEPWQSTFTDEALDRMLARHGLAIVDRLNADEALARYPTDDAALTPNAATAAVASVVLPAR